jgi:hypothetical protein
LSDTAKVDGFAAASRQNAGKPDCYGICVALEMGVLSQENAISRNTSTDLLGLSDSPFSFLCRTFPRNSQPLVPRKFGI